MYTLGARHGGMRPAWSTKNVPGQPGLKLCLKKLKTKQNKTFILYYFFKNYYTVKRMKVNREDVKSDREQNNTVYR